MDCVFCRIRDGQIPSTRVYEDDRTIAFMDINPLNEGHTLVIPRAHAATLYKRLLALDGERQDIRDRLRKISSGRRRRVGPALPRIAVALGIALLLGGVAIVWVKQQGVLGQPQPGREEGPLAELLGRASEEKAGAVRAGAKAATIYTQLLEDLRSNPFQGTPEEAASARNRRRVSIITSSETPVKPAARPTRLAGCPRPQSRHACSATAAR